MVWVSVWLCWSAASTPRPLSGSSMSSQWEAVSEFEVLTQNALIVNTPKAHEVFWPTRFIRRLRRVDYCRCMGQSDPNYPPTTGNPCRFGVCQWRLLIRCVVWYASYRGSCIFDYIVINPCSCLALRGLDRQGRRYPVAA